MKYRGTEVFGVYCNNYTQEVTKKLKGCPYAQAGIIVYDNCIELKSYTSTILRYYNNGDIVIYGLYLWSRTTQKHIKAFLNEYIPNVSYQLIKQLFEDYKVYNTITGEVTNIENTQYNTRA